jgi:hypothetical protein
MAAGAMYIVSGDAHLLDLKQYQGIFILTATGFLTVLRLAEGKKKKGMKISNRRPVSSGG